MFLEFPRALTFTTFKRRLPKVTNPSWILPRNVLRFLLGNYIFLSSIRDFVSTFRANESSRLVPSSVFFVSMKRKVCVMLLQQRQQQDFFVSPRAGWPLFERGRVNIEFVVSSDIVGLSKIDEVVFRRVFVAFRAKNCPKLMPARGILLTETTNGRHARAYLELRSKLHLYLNVYRMDLFGYHEITD